MMPHAQVFMHPYAGVLSAYGMGLADIGALRERTVELPLEPQQLAAVEATLAELAAEATAEVRGASRIASDSVKGSSSTS